MVPNAFAFLVLGLWPLVAFGLFRALPPGRAILANVFVAYLFLPPPPTQFYFPLVPLDKDTLPSVTLIVIALLMYRDKIEIFPKNKVALTLVLIFVFSPILTAFANTDPIFYERVGLPGLSLKDGIAIVARKVLMIGPFLLARQFLRTEEGQRDLLIAFVLFGLLYSLPMLVEVRLSPQLNIWIYGFFQHSFEQMIRFGGFRPIVFLYHGLWAALFAMMAVSAAAILSRAEEGSHRGIAILSCLYMLAVLVLCKSAGSLLYAVALLPALVILPRALKIRLALVIVMFTMAYPLVKGAGLLPEEQILAAVERLSEDRANSLRFRMDNEAILLERALERPLFGWGSWGRNQILDPITGAITTVSDGRWVIILGQLGWVGFLSEMSLLIFPILLLWFKIRRFEGDEWSPYIGGIALLLAVNIFDLLPNATLTPLSWLMCGTLLGYAETAQGTKRAAKMKLQSVM